MPLTSALQKNWNETAASRPFLRTLAMDETGVGLGKTLLACFEREKLNVDAKRIRTMLSVTYGREISGAVVDSFYNAERCWKRGDVTLAQMHLALTGLTAINVEQAQRLFVADWAMSRGVSSQQLLKFAGVLRKDDSDDDDEDGEDAELDSASPGVDAYPETSSGNSHYNPDEPRIPAGQPGAGQWTTGSATASDPEPITLAATGDQRFGLPDDFWSWYHRQVKQPGDSDITRPEVIPIYNEWLRLGRPGPDQG